MPKIAVVTGCSSGLGRELSIALASQIDKEGNLLCKVFATTRKKEALEDLKSKGIAVVQLDVTSEASAQACFAAVHGIAGRIDLLICNAGVAATAPLVEEPIQEVENIFSTNTFGVLRCIQAAAPFMMKQRSGRIVVVGSFTACLSSPFNGAYAGSKAAVHTFCETFRMELEPFGIELSEVWAGTFKTDINAKVSAGLDRYSKPSSAYQPIYTDICERAAILEKANAMSPEKVATAIVRGCLRTKAPRYITTGSEVGICTFLGYLQLWLCPGLIKHMLQDMFGLKKLKSILSKSHS